MRVLSHLKSAGREGKVFDDIKNFDKMIINNEFGFKVILLF